VLVYVTGVSGSGKSTVCAELVRRGYDARDTDDGISAWFRIADGAEVPTPFADGYRTAEWCAAHEWRYSTERVVRFADAVRGGVGFLCGGAANENEVWSLVDRALYLVVDARTLRERLARRTNNDFGKASDELEAILAWHAGAADHCRRYGIDPVDATRPVDEVVDDILHRCSA
jgi:shikimate kinase